MNELGYVQYTGSLHIIDRLLPGVGEILLQSIAIYWNFVIYIAIL